MKQTVNWYKGDVKPTKRTLTLARALTATSAVIVLCLLGRSNRLALWMMRFSETELLSRTAFAMVELARDEQGQQLFTLRSKRDNDGNESVSEAAQ